MNIVFVFLFSLLVLQLQTKDTLGFGVVVRLSKQQAGVTRLHGADTDSSEDSSSSSLPFPVLKKIAGVDWEGSCRYVNEELIPASFTLRGGIRFDLNGSSSSSDDDSDNDVNDDGTVELNSSIVFPNGKSREIQMRYVQYNTIYAPCATGPFSFVPHPKLLESTNPDPIQLITSILAPV